MLYWLGIVIRNWLFDKDILKSSSFAFPLICVGNLSAGGTGKSPMVEYIVRLLKSRYKVATLSRGYKRKTKGYALAGPDTTALEIGDEPMQFHLKFPDVAVVVGEEWIVAIPQLLHDRPDTQAIILDDAFQHRSVKAGLNILLTDYNNLFTQDFYLPTGELRDLKSQYKRAQIIVVTKCDPLLSDEEKTRIIKDINPLPGQDIYFTAIQYGEPYHILHNTVSPIADTQEVLLVTGIANPRPLQAWLEKKARAYHLLEYSDHHIFSIDDLKEIAAKFKAINGEDKIILTTEKDAVRLVKFNSEIADWPLYVVPIRHYFLFNEGHQFDERVIDFVENFKPQS